MVLKPNEGIGEIVIGMPREHVRAVMGEEPIQKPSDSPVPSDFFPTQWMIVHYDGTEAVEAIEVTKRDDVMFMGRPLIDAPFEDVLKWIRSIDPRVEVEEAGFTSYRFGVGVYAPHSGKTPSDRIESVIVFRPGYYDGSD